MKDNIANKFIGNRKIIIELRLKAKPTILDHLGELAEAMEKSKVFPTTNWEIDGGTLVTRNNAVKEEASDVFSVSFNRIHYISDKIDRDRKSVV